MFGIDDVLVGLAIKYVPDLLGAIFGDKTGQVAKDAIQVVRDVTGTTDRDQAQAALDAHPGLVAQLQEKMLEVKERADQRAHEQRLAELTIVGQQIAGALQDVQNARQRDVEISRSGRTNIRANVMVGIAVLGVVAIAVLLALDRVDGASAAGGFLISVGTLLAGKVGTAFDFEFGGSRGQMEAQALLAGSSPSKVASKTPEGGRRGT